MAELGDFTVATMPGRFASVGDVQAGMGDAVGSLDKLLELAARDETEGLGDAPWPPHFAKAEGEPKRVQPSRSSTGGAKSFAGQLGEGFGEKRFRKRAVAKTAEAEGAEPAAASDATEPKPVLARKTRASKMPLLVIAHSQDKEEAEAGLARWKAKYPAAAALLAEDDVLVDRMRGTAYVWYRIRVNLRHVPEAERPAQETPDPDDDPTREWKAD